MEYIDKDKKKIYVADDSLDREQQYDLILEYKREYKGYWVVFEDEDDFIYGSGIGKLMVSITVISDREELISSLFQILSALYPIEEQSIYWFSPGQYAAITKKWGMLRLTYQEKKIRIKKMEESALLPNSNVFRREYDIYNKILSDHGMLFQSRYAVNERGMQVPTIEEINVGLDLNGEMMVVKSRSRKFNNWINKNIKYGNEILEVLKISKSKKVNLCDSSYNLSVSKSKSDSDLFETRRSITGSSSKHIDIQETINSIQKIKKDEEDRIKAIKIERFHQLIQEIKQVSKTAGFLSLTDLRFTKNDNNGKAITKAFHDSGLSWYEHLDLIKELYNMEPEQFYDSIGVLDRKERERREAQRLKKEAFENEIKALFFTRFIEYLKNDFAKNDWVDSMDDFDRYFDHKEFYSDVIHQMPGFVRAEENQFVFERDGMVINFRPDLRDFKSFIQEKYSMIPSAFLRKIGVINRNKDKVETFRKTLSATIFKAFILYFEQDHLDEFDSCSSTEEFDDIIISQRGIEDLWDVEAIYSHLLPLLAKEQNAEYSLEETLLIYKGHQADCSWEGLLNYIQDTYHCNAEEFFRLKGIIKSDEEIEKFENLFWESCISLLRDKPVKLGGIEIPNNILIKIRETRSILDLEKIYQEIINIVAKSLKGKIVIYRDKYGSDPKEVFMCRGACVDCSLIDFYEHYGSETDIEEYLLSNGVISEIGIESEKLTEYRENKEAWKAIAEAINAYDFSDDDDELIFSDDDDELN